MDADGQTPPYTQIAHDSECHAHILEEHCKVAAAETSGLGGFSWLFFFLIETPDDLQKWPCSLVWHYTVGTLFSVPLFRGVDFGTTKILGSGLAVWMSCRRSPCGRRPRQGRPVSELCRRFPDSTRNKGPYTMTCKARAHCFLVSRRQQHKETGIIKVSSRSLGASCAIRRFRTRAHRWRCQATRAHTRTHTHTCTQEEIHKGRLLRSLHG